MFDGDFQVFVDYLGQVVVVFDLYFVVFCQQLDVLVWLCWWLVGGGMQGQGEYIVGYLVVCFDLCIVVV